MKSIETKYLGSTNYRGSRIVATDCGDHHITIPCDSAMDSDDNHKLAALTLMTKLNWHGKMQGGHTKTGMCFVFEDQQKIIERSAT